MRSKSRKINQETGKRRKQSQEVPVQSSPHPKNGMCLLFKETNEWGFGGWTQYLQSYICTADAKQGKESNTQAKQKAEEYNQALMRAELDLRDQNERSFELVSEVTLTPADMAFHLVGDKLSEARRPSSLKPLKPLLEPSQPLQRAPLFC